MSKVEKMKSLSSAVCVDTHTRAHTRARARTRTCVRTGLERGPECGGLEYLGKETGLDPAVMGAMEGLKQGAAPSGHLSS